MMFTLQDLAVTVAALGAAGVFVRRHTASRRSSSGKPSCPTCASGGCAPSPAKTGDAAVHPLHVIAPRREN
jgi:hypothetical protein